MFIDQKFLSLEKRANIIKGDQEKIFEFPMNESTHKFLKDFKKDVDGEIMIEFSQIH